jgi:hypothetical protein
MFELVGSLGTRRHVLLCAGGPSSVSQWTKRAVKEYGAPDPDASNRYVANKNRGRSLQF